MIKRDSLYAEIKVVEAGSFGMGRDSATMFLECLHGEFHVSLVGAVDRHEVI